ncbi:MAG: DJ-1/PfpI family protein [Pseudoxanthomonas sp.]
MTRKYPQNAPLLPAIAAVIGFVGLNGASMAVASPSATHTAAPTSLRPWSPVHGHTQALVAIAGENSGTELTDFAIPYGVLKRAGIDTVTVAAHQGPLRFRPALKAQLDSTMAEFDLQHPEGADYVVVPAMVNYKDPTVTAWLAEQSRKGATVVSICDGALVVGSAGLLDGKWATAHWASESVRLKAFPTAHWVRNTRYVADGNVVSSAGISAAMPTALALVEAIAGTQRASAVAREIGVADWSPRHDSDAFRPHYGNLSAFAIKLIINPYLHGTDKFGVPLVPGMDEINLAVTADAYSRTGRSRVISIAPKPGPIPTLNGLRILPDAVGKTKDVDVVLPRIDSTLPGKAFDNVLASIKSRYGRKTAFGVALDFEYPGFNP